ncbi:MAG: hypothetical protein C0412_01230 [Flavobacterium sp.]|nr:hypothetical protein [Flavobacterium sp.]
MSVRKNTIANFIGQLYSSLIGIFMLPFYLKHLGAEAYGLVGFFTVFSNWLRLLDLGLSPTLSREIVVARSSLNARKGFRELLRSVEIVFVFFSCIIIFSVVALSDFLGREWFKLEVLKVSEVAYCISIMGIMAGLSWFTSIYSSGINGMELQVWQNTAVIILSSFRFIGAFFLLKFYSREITVFFNYQLFVSFFNLIVYGVKFYKVLPGEPVEFKFYYHTFRAKALFSSSVAYLGIILLITTQLDKMVLSHYLSLKEYGYFALVAMIANATARLSGPITTALLPRITVLFTQKKEAQMVKLYRGASQLVSACIFPFVLTISVFSTDLLFFWTGDKIAATWGGEILRWYILGNGLTTIVSYQYLLQFSHGNLGLHVKSMTLYALFCFPTTLYAVSSFGGIGAALVWFGSNLFLLIFYVPFIHSRFVPGIHVKWLLVDILPSIVISFIVLITLKKIFPGLGEVPRIQGLTTLVSFGFLTLIINCFFSKECRNQASLFFCKFAREGEK